VSRSYDVVEERVEQFTSVRPVAERSPRGPRGVRRERRYRGIANGMEYSSEGGRLAKCSMALLSWRPGRKPALA
jgi:hypothetical protein